MSTDPIDEKERENSESALADQAACVGVAHSTSEVVGRYGDANAEYIKGFRGVDLGTGQTFAKSLDGVSKYKVDPNDIDRNLKQQAGFSAETAATSRDNAEAIIGGSKVRTTRADDLPQYGNNHSVVDRVQVLDGKIIDGTETQMKFVGDRDQLFKRIASEDGKFARYRGIKLELPSEQFKGAKELCLRKAEELRGNATAAQQVGTSPEIVAKLRTEADNYEQLANDVSDSGLTTEDALFYRKHPKIATALDIGRTSHRAGLEGAKTGALIGSVIAVIQSGFAVAQEKQSLGDAAKVIVASTGKAAGLGYGTAFVGAAIKANMQQSANQTLRQLANTSAPVLALNICLSLSGSIKRYVEGDIDESQLLEAVGEQGIGMLSSGMAAALGQVLIPVPFVGAAIGGMIGYSISSMFYQIAVDAGRDAAAAKVRLARVKEIETEARARIAQERAALDSFMCKEFPELELETRQLFAVVDAREVMGIDAFSAAINRYAELLGVQLEFKTLIEFDSFMATDQPLRL